MSYFIIDTHGESEVNKFREADFEYYIWDKSRFNKVEEGDRFIYRRPKKSSENNLFYFFGAGQFGEIELIDNIEGRRRVRSRIINGISFDEPIYQSNLKLQTYEWEFKDGKSYVSNDYKWLYFFNQYGMTEITEKDYYFLLGLLNENSYSVDLDKKEVRLSKSEPIPEIKIPASFINHKKGYPLGYEKYFNESKKTKNICMELVYKKEREIVSSDKELSKYLNKVRFAENIESDGRAFDIISFRKIDNQVKEILISVKGTKHKLDTPFMMTASELFLSKEKPSNYYLYRVSIENRKDPRYFVVTPNIIDKLNLVPMNYIAGICNK